MRKSIRIPAAVALSLALAVPPLTQSAHPQNAPAQTTAQAPALADGPSPAALFSASGRTCQAGRAGL